jgi:hypothetical protein
MKNPDSTTQHLNVFSPQWRAWAHEEPQRPSRRRLYEDLEGAAKRIEHRDDEWFSAGLLGLHLRTPGMRRAGSLRPTQQGLPIAKDVWMLGAGLVVDALTDSDR